MSVHNDGNRNELITNCAVASGVPPQEPLPDGLGTAEWPAWDTTAHPMVTASERLIEARGLITALVAAMAGARNTFRADSGLRKLQRGHGQPVHVRAPLHCLITGRVDPRFDPRSPT